MKKLTLLLVLAVMMSSPAFAAKRCRENGKFVKCPPAAAVTAPAAVAPAPAAPVVAPAVVPAPVQPAVAPAPVSKEGVSVTQRTSSKGKVYNQCRDKKTGHFVKCPQ